jgi:GNAT superfamily N-acetyltransferase
MAAEHPTAIEIVEVPIPTAVGTDGWDLFEAVAAVDSAVEVAAYGTPEVAASAADLLPDWQDPKQIVRLLAAVDTGRVVGSLGVYAERETPDTGFAQIKVLPGERRRGIGTLLDARLDALVREQGYRKLIAYAVSPEAAGERLAPPTGAGSVPRDNPEVGFLLARGWRLEQVERASRYPLPPDAALLDRLRADAERHSEGYRGHTWAGPSPEPFRAGMAELYERMTTDAPSAGLEEPPETWDVARVIEHESRQDRVPATMLVAAVEHVATGRLAGMTRLRVPDDPGRAVQQWDTIVRREDRGHRLGTLLKVVNLQELAARMPGHPSILTWNAEENRHMLDVNEAIGFVPIGQEGAWRKDLP